MSLYTNFQTMENSVSVAGELNNPIVSGNNVNIIISYSAMFSIH